MPLKRARLYLCFRVYHLFAPVKTAFWANPVQQDPVAAGAAFDEGRCGKLHIDGLPAAGPGFGRLKSRYSHVKILALY
jgi:hypothetical protein